MSNTRKSLAPSSHAHLPPEIWQDVFYYVNADAWLGNEEILEEKFKRIELIRNINLTCRTFRCLAQPLLCHTLQVYPFTRGSLRGSPARIALREDIAEDNIQRLMFFASDRIAPYVRSIFVDLGRYRGGPHADDCNFVLRSLVRRLHHFIGLEKLIFAERLGLGFDDFVAPVPSYGPTQVIPLTHYIGPRALFHLLPSTPTLRTLQLLSLEESGFDDAVHLIPALSTRDITSQVARLTLSIDFLTEDIFRNIFLIFPRLNDIRMTTSKNFFGDVSVVPAWIETLLQVDVSPTIRDIYINSLDPCNHDKDVDDPSLERRLFQKYPLLLRVYIASFGITFACRRPVSS